MITISKLNDSFNNNSAFSNEYNTFVKSTIICIHKDTADEFWIRNKFLSNKIIEGKFKSIEEIFKEVNDLLTQRSKKISTYIQLCSNKGFKTYENRYWANGEKRFWQHLIKISSDLYVLNLFELTSIFMNFWDENNNFIQIAGPNLIIELSDPKFSKKKVWGYVHPFVTSSIQDQTNKKFIPKLNYTVERNKIFYGTNFNRNFGFLRTVQLSKTSKNRDLQERTKSRKKSKGNKIIYVK